MKTSTRLNSSTFELVKTVEVIVPKGYVFSSYMGTFASKHRKEFRSYNKFLGDKHYGAGVGLKPGQRLEVKMFGITVPEGIVVSNSACVDFLTKSKSSMLLGAHGAAMVYQQLKGWLPFGSIVSFGLAGNRSYSCNIHKNKNNIFDMDVSFPESDLDSGCFLLCFRRV